MIAEPGQNVDFLKSVSLVMSADIWSATARLPPWPTRPMFSELLKLSCKMDHSFDSTTCLIVWEMSPNSRRFEYCFAFTLSIVKMYIRNDSSKIY